MIKRNNENANNNNNNNNNNNKDINMKKESLQTFTRIKPELDY